MTNKKKLFKILYTYYKYKRDQKPKCLRITAPKMANQRNEKYQVSEDHIEQSCLPGLGHLYWGCYMR